MTHAAWRPALNRGVLQQGWSWETGDSTVWWDVGPVWSWRSQTFGDPGARASGDEGWGPESEKEMGRSPNPQERRRHEPGLKSQGGGSAWLQVRSLSHGWVFSPSWETRVLNLAASFLPCPMSTCSSVLGRAPAAQGEDSLHWALQSAGNKLFDSFCPAPDYLDLWPSRTISWSIFGMLSLNVCFGELYGVSFSCFILY